MTFRTSSPEDDGTTSQLVVRKITWAQVGRVDEPGRYLFRFGWLTITVDDLGIWRSYPNAAFTLLRILPIQTKTMDTTGEYRLGLFELRKNISLGERRDDALGER